MSNEMGPESERGYLMASGNTVVLNVKLPLLVGLTPGCAFALDSNASHYSLKSCIHIHECAQALVTDGSVCV